MHSNPSPHQPTPDRSVRSASPASDHHPTTDSERAQVEDAEIVEIDASNVVSIGRATERLAIERIDPPTDGGPARASLLISGKASLPVNRAAAAETDQVEPALAPIESPITPAPSMPAASTPAAGNDARGRLSKDAATAGKSSLAAPSGRTETSPSRRASRSSPDPVVQSLMLLLTMGIMLAAARFAVPSVVEEIRYAWLRGELRAEYETGTEGLRNVSLDALSDAYEMVTAAVGPSVVHIDVQRRPEIELTELGNILSESPHSDQGSGVIVDAAGYLVTNRHVVAGGEDITVTLSDGRHVPAVIIGNDALTDLAVLKIEADGLIPITWGDSDRCRVGSPVWAVGSPFGLDRTVTFGILSGKHRRVRASTQYQDFMQSDVAVNPGNSGGPLVDSRGTLVGINTAIVGDTYQGVSFSIPSNVAKQIYERLVASGRVDRGWLGVRLLEVPDEQIVGNNPRLRGALVSEVTAPTSPAGRAGVREGDVITQIDQESIRDTAHLMQLIARSLSGSRIVLGVVRDDEPIDLTVTLGTMPAEYNR